MRIIDQVEDGNLIFVEHDFFDKSIYEIYYFETKLYQSRGKYKDAVTKWSEIVQEVMCLHKK